MKEIIGVGLKEIIDVVQKRKVLKRIKGKDYVCAYPKYDKTRTPTPGQQAAREKFKKCSAYASAANKDAVMKNAYEMMAKNGQTAHNLAFADAYHSPSVTNIVHEGYFGRVGNLIYVQAEDDFLVKRVVVSIYRHKKVIEVGEALQCGENLWIYTATALISKVRSVKIVATAYDMPGNSGTLEVMA